ncbi:JAB domain-containing protein [Lactobacillus jensenii]|jgi:DNA repair protein radC|uniref:JAB domain-containing protein n=1 Tax=Lactobacillus jensenii TaxID=109790 RepID=A0A5N1IAC4_LACJE|nr:JAB domain-containing protein [Lactobacillus jensenii]EEQ68178.1 DNA repair protein RadC [Lactobacillus jensenii 1153]ERJ42735.1 DNA repair protein RadC [Lactobacillus jensenii MD IIE-70(2)]APT14975.1 DNA repair protein RadC [Lactobacillus jensenii]EEQ24495.1 DNA repair protein RadC [Lactobacillus jensenii 269-3]EEX27680.1 DNA repair protein RadC [Lactobacillus jensenii SJ-7A-US]
MQIADKDHYLLKTDQELLSEIFILLEEAGITSFVELNKFLLDKKLENFGQIYDYLTSCQIDDELLSRTITLLKRLKAVRTRKLIQFVSSHEVGKYLIDRFLGIEQEQLVVIYLDNKNKVLGERLLFQGTVNRSVVHPRDIFRWAVFYNSVGILIAHNHPSGDTSPSQKDIEFTKQIDKASDLMGINFLDHIIVADRSYLSFKEEQLI